MTMASDNDWHDRSMLYYKLLDLVDVLNGLPTRDGLCIESFPYDAVHRRFRLRACANKGDYSELLNLLDNFRDKMKNAGVEYDVLLNLQGMALKVDFEKANVKATTYLRSLMKIL
eukprot:Gregarina_sp_Poly_1__5099@NODE_26_length_19795_cov_50_913828_g24_i0_p13_GENE_NODE_26_length_19795_cov_50_913828_g24_i0NODE_26_length_19795_cov_50_913828_g24_i0_p13_ORF_typecomplete_len115_score14_18PPR_3/PF13812_6/0_06_NODE_26_length_19795_cov_50_913828_g24_i01754917893